MAYVDYISEETQIVNDHYMAVIHQYLKVMIPKTLKEGYDRVHLPGIETVKTVEIPSQGIYDVIGYVYDTLMGFEGYLDIGANEPVDIKEFKKSVYTKLLVFKKLMQKLEDARLLPGFDEKKLNIDKLYNDSLKKVQSAPSRNEGR